MTDMIIRESRPRNSSKLTGLQTSSCTNWDDPPKQGCGWLCVSNLVTWRKSKITSHRTQAVGGCLSNVRSKTVGTCSESRSAAILRVLGSIFYLLSIFYLSSIYLLSIFYLSLTSIYSFVSLLSCFFPASFGSAKYSRKTSSGAVCHWYIDLPVRSSQKTTVLQAAPSSEEEVLALVKPSSKISFD
jgi:hypothetical protein